MTPPVPPPERVRELLEVWQSNADACRSHDLETGIADEYVAVFQDYLRRVEADEWQPIETAPRDGTRVIFGWNDGSPSRYGFYHESKAWPWAGFRPPSLEVDFKTQPTHWRPLPPPPPEAASTALEGEKS